MKQQCLSSKLTYARPIPIGRIIASIADRAQNNTQYYGKRPYGVGLMVAGVDDAGPHLHEFMPSGMTQEMLACAIGARSQMARTYLERHLAEFEDASRDDLIKHGLMALKESLNQDKELTFENTTIGVVGVGSGKGASRIEGFKLYDGQETTAYLEKLETTEGGRPEGSDETMGVDNDEDA